MSHHLLLPDFVILFEWFVLSAFVVGGGFLFAFLFRTGVCFVPDLLYSLLHLLKEGFGLGILDLLSRVGDIGRDVRIPTIEEEIWRHLRFRKWGSVVDVLHVAEVFDP